MSAISAKPTDIADGRRRLRAGDGGSAFESAGWFCAGFPDVDAAVMRAGGSSASASTLPPVTQAGDAMWSDRAEKRLVHPGNRTAPEPQSLPLQNRTVDRRDALRSAECRAPRRDP